LNQSETADALRRHSEAATQGVDVLSRFLQLENLEISSSVFPTHDWRRWLTLTSNSYIVISARNAETKKLAHGVILRTDFFNEMIRRCERSTRLSPDLARAIYRERNLEAPLKRMGESLGPAESRKRAQSIIEELLA
jgi:hypothetical protein